MQRNGHFIRTRPPLRPPRHSNKILLPSTLKRIVSRNLVLSFDSLKKNSSQLETKLNRLEKIVSINMSICFLFAWEKFKLYNIKQKSKERALRSALTLAKNVQKSMIKTSFQKLRNLVSVQNQNAYIKIVQSRKNILFNCLKKLFVNKKKSVIQKLQKNVALSKQFKRITSINPIINGFKRRLLILSWSKLTKVNQKKVQPNQLNQKTKIQEMSHHIQDMEIQLLNKNQTITRLRQQIVELKNSSYVQVNQTNNSFLINNSFGNKSGTNLNRSRHRSSQKQISDGGSLYRDNSILGHSFLSYKSKGSNAGSRLDECPCSTCSYRDRYEKYKATSQTLKKQLEIIKTQLQFTKDMNEHLQNQIRNQLGNDDRESKIQRLRSELKQSHKDRDALREKLLKYEKYVTKLKAEFKIKIQEIYRRVKKGN